MSWETVKICGAVMYVEYDFEHDSGYRYDSDGHGLPESCDVQVTTIQIGGIDVTDLIFSYSQELVETIEREILESRL